MAPQFVLTSLSTFQYTRMYGPLPGSFSLCCRKLLSLQMQYFALRQNINQFFCLFFIFSFFFMFISSDPGKFKEMFLPCVFCRFLFIQTQSKYSNQTKKCDFVCVCVSPCQMCPWSSMGLDFFGKVWICLNKFEGQDRASSFCTEIYAANFRYNLYSNHMGWP